MSYQGGLSDALNATRDLNQFERSVDRKSKDSKHSTDAKGWLKHSKSQGDTLNSHAHAHGGKAHSSSRTAVGDMPQVPPRSRPANLPRTNSSPAIYHAQQQ